MGDVTTVGLYLDAVRTHIASATGVPVFTAAVDHLSIGEEAVVLAVDPVEVECVYRTLPAVEVFEQYPVDGRIWVVKPGGGEAAIKAARDRALYLLSLVVTELVAHNTPSATARTQFGGVDDTRVVSWRLEQYVVDGGRDCRAIFKVAQKATFNPAS